MGLLTRSKSSAGSTTPTAPDWTVTEARLRLVVAPPGDWLTQRLRWERRARDWETPALQERFAALRADIHALKAHLKLIPPEQGAEYDRLYRRLQGWRGQLDAIQQELTRRATATLSPTSRACRPGGSAWNTACAEPGVDPFATE